MVQKYTNKSSGLADWMKENIPERLTVFSFPKKHRRRWRSTNGLERLNREILYRTQVAVPFPNTASCLRQTALAMEISVEWQTGHVSTRLDDDDYC
ncbi:MAG: hypothetical protein BMS9Abin02_1164 [Anaerolineae bacterium]|nr:MAG: hypothetical protein BMS9Abin02_1164 [Anaerolineae bacterium]